MGKGGLHHLLVEEPARSKIATQQHPMSLSGLKFLNVLLEL